MASLILRNVPNTLLHSLRERAASAGRSLGEEVLLLLEDAVRRSARDISPEDRRQAQVREWSRLVGRWKSDIPVDEEIALILEARD